jgi:hypothetical protein
MMAGVAADYSAAARRGLYVLPPQPANEESHQQLSPGGVCPCITSGRSCSASCWRADRGISRISPRLRCKRAKLMPCDARFPRCSQPESPVRILISTGLDSNTAPASQSAVMGRGERRTHHTSHSLPQPTVPLGCLRSRNARPRAACSED